MGKYFEKKDEETVIEVRDFAYDKLKPIEGKYEEFKKEVLDKFHSDKVGVNKYINLEVIPKPAICRLPEEWTYDALGLAYSAYFLKGGFCLKPTRPHYTEELYYPLINTIAELHLSNLVRAFFWMNEGWKANEEELVMPHPLETRTINGKKVTKYNLHIDNPLWENQVFNRLDYNAERRITTDVIINDGHGIRNFHSHWLVREHNWGWNNKPTYRADSTKWYGWTQWVHYKRPEDIKEYLEGKITEEEAWEIVHEYESTRDYLLAKYAKFLPKLAGYLPYVRISNNEIDSRNTWHQAMYKIAHEAGFNRKFLTTSLFYPDWYKETAITDRWIPELHGINTLAGYEECKNLTAGVPFTLCADGFWENWDSPEIPQVIRRAVEDGQKGFIGNSEGKEALGGWASKELIELGIRVRNSFKGALRA